MEIEIPLFQGLSVKIGDIAANGKDFPTARLQKGFILLDQGLDLAEEAVGFGVPVLKRGLQTIFPGAAELAWNRTGSTWNITAVFKLNLVEKISKGGKENVENTLLYATKNILAAMIRWLPWSRKVLTGISSNLRRIFNWETAYAEAGFSTELQLIYTVEPQAGKITIEIDTSRLPPGIDEVVVMNEQGAHYFDWYSDTAGISLREDGIGNWDEVHAEKAWFEGSTRRVLFKLGKVQGARLFRGRELIGSRLAWAGFGYSFAPFPVKFRYELTIEKSN